MRRWAGTETLKTTPHASATLERYKDSPLAALTAAGYSLGNAKFAVKLAAGFDKAAGETRALADHIRQWAGLAVSTTGQDAAGRPRNGLYILNAFRMMVVIGI